MVSAMHKGAAVLWLMLSCVAVAGCSPSTDSRVTPAPATDSVEVAAFASRPELKATFVDSKDVELAWTNQATAECAWFVEFSLGSEVDFSILTIVPPQTTTFRHPDVAAGTTFNYRVRPAFGGASKVASAKTGPAATAASQAAHLENEGPLEGEPPPAAAAKASLRNLSTAPDAVPTDLTAALSSPSSVDLRWTDRAADEAAYLVEVSAEPDRNFAVCALLPPDANSFRKAHLPPEMTCYFRVRAFFHGNPSNRASVTTTSEPSGERPADGRAEGYRKP
jgi:hypothetical protein